MICYHLEEFKIKHVKAGRVVLRDLDLFEERLAENGHGDAIQLLKDVNEMLKHEVSDLELPVELDQDEGQNLVEQRCGAIFDLREGLEEPKH